MRLNLSPCAHRYDQPCGCFCAANIRRWRRTPLRTTSRLAATHPVSRPGRTSGHYERDAREAAKNPLPPESECRAMKSPKTMPFPQSSVEREAVSNSESVPCLAAYILRITSDKCGPDVYQAHKLAWIISRIMNPTFVLIMFREAKYLHCLIHIQTSRQSWLEESGLLIHILMVTRFRRLPGSVWPCCSEIFCSESVSEETDSAWLGAWFLVRSSFSSISP